MGDRKGETAIVPHAVTIAGILRETRRDILTLGRHFVPLVLQVLVISVPLVKMGRKHIVSGKIGLTRISLLAHILSGGYRMMS